MVLYSPVTSLNGAKLLLNKGPPRKATIEDVSNALAAPTILTPHALPMFRDAEGGRGTKRKAEKDRMDPRKSRRPELPVTGPGRGGRVGASATQHVVQNLVRDTTRDVDVSTTSSLVIDGGRDADCVIVIVAAGGAVAICRRQGSAMDQRCVVVFGA